MRRTARILASAAAALALAVPLLAGPARGASLDPSFRMLTRTTPHFEIHYHPELAPVAERLAEIAERHHGPMASLFRWEPRERTRVVLADSTDLANGYSTALPYDAIRLYPVPPDVDSTIGEYGDWLEALFVHEYAHVLTSDPSRGYSEWTRAVFGKPLPAGDLLSLLTFLVAAPPNTFLPRWWHEGAATWAETAFTAKGGRGRGAYAEMVYRAAVAEGTLPSIDQANESLPPWPDGHIPYFFGLRLMRHVSETEGAGAVGADSESHAGRFPYALNGTPEYLFREKGYRELYREALDNLAVEQRGKLDRIRAAGATVPRTVRDDGERLSSPRWSPDGKLLAWRREDPHGRATIEVAHASGTKAATLSHGGYDGSVSWAPDSDTLYFTRGNYTAGGYGFYRDLYSARISSGAERRLTTGMRLAAPDASPDGRSVAAVATGGGRHRLVLLSPGGKDGKGWAVVTAMDTAPETRLSRPRWSPDGKAVAVVETDGRTGRSALLVFDPATGERRVVAAAEASLADPCWSRDGSRLFFVSAETGVFNLFAVPAAGGVRSQVTNLEGGAFTPEPSPDGKSLLFSSYHARGFRLAEVPLDPASWRAEAGPAISPGWTVTVRPDDPRRDGGGAAQRREGDPPAKGSGKAGGGSIGAEAPGAGGTGAGGSSVAPYSPLSTLLPRFWLPVLLSDHDGVAPGAFTAGIDALGRHSALLLGAVGIPSGEPYFAASYAYDRWYPTFLLDGWSLPAGYSELVREEDYFERDTGAEGRIEIPFYRRDDTRFSLSLGGRFDRVTALTDLSEAPFDNAAVLPFRGNRGGFVASASFVDAVRYRYSISPEEGREVTLSFRNDSRSLGDLSRREWTARWTEFLGMPGELLRHHVLVAELRGGLSDGDRTLQGAFQLGGPPSLLSAFPLRGYPSRFEPGSRAATATAEYRFPAWSLYRGPGTAPLFLHRIHGTVFADTGETWGDGIAFSGGRLKTGVGTEVKADVTLGYWLRLTPGIGFAYGLNEDGEAQLYFRLDGFL